MSLFSGLPIGGVCDAMPQRFVTPLGELALTLSLSGVALERADRIHALGQSGHIHSWLRPDCEVKLLLFSFSPALPEGMHVSAAIAAMWRVRASRRVDDLVFSCAWHGPTHFTEAGGPESGQWLDSLSWHDARHKVAVGTEDGDCYAVRGRQNDWVPQRLINRQDAPDKAVRQADWLELGYYRDDGFDIRLPALLPGEQFSCQFVCAWAPFTEDELATWFTVEQSPKALLASLGLAADPSASK